MGLVCLFGLYYVMDNIYLPYNEEGILNINNFILVSVLFVFSVAFIIAAIHIFFDDKFVKKFYQTANVPIAMRRGFEVAIAVVSLAWLRVFGYWEWKFILLFFSLFLLLEAFFIAISQKPSTDANDLEAKSMKGRSS